MKKLMIILLVICIPLFFNQIFNFIEVPKIVDSLSYIILSISLVIMKKSKPE